METEMTSSSPYQVRENNGGLTYTVVDMSKEGTEDFEVYCTGSKEQCLDFAHLMNSARTHRSHYRIAL